MKTRSLIKIRIIIILLSIGNVMMAQTDSVDLIIKNQMQKRKIPRLQLAIIKDGKLIKVQNLAKVTS